TKKTAQTAADAGARSTRTVIRTHAATKDTEGYKGHREKPQRRATEAQSGRSPMCRPLRPLIARCVLVTSASRDCAHYRRDRVDDVIGGDSKAMQELLRFPAARYLPDGEPVDGEPRVGHSLGNGVAQPA